MTDVGLHRGYNIDPTSTNPLMFACVGLTFHALARSLAPSGRVRVLSRALLLCWLDAALLLMLPLLLRCTAAAGCAPVGLLQ